MASVTYNIKGKYDGSAVNQAQKGISSLASSAKTFNTIVGGFIVGKAMQGIKKITDGAAESFLKQNAAVKNFESSLKNSLTPLSELEKIRAQMSHNNLIDDDQINNALALGNNMGLTAQQMQDVMSAASELSASGVMPLDQAVKALGSSYTGTAGTLSKSIPQLKELTKEQLKNGEAVKIVSETYKGYADNLSTTFSGRNTQFNNTFSDLQASVGSIIQSLKFVSQGNWLGPITKMTDYIKENRDTILKFFLNLPQLSEATFDGIKQMIAKTFSLDFFEELSTRIFSGIFGTGVACFRNLVTLINDLFSVGLQIGKILANKILEGINWVGNKLPSWAKSLFGIDGKVDFRFAIKTDSLETLIENQKNGIKEAFATGSAALKKVGELYKDDAQKLVEKLKNVLNNSDLPEDLKKALSNVSVTTEGSSTGLSTSSGDSEISNTTQLLDGLWGSIGMVGTIINQFMNSNIVGIIINLFVSLASSMSSKSEAFSKIMNGLSTLMDALVDAIGGDAMEDTFGPFVEALQMIGGIIGSVIGPAMQLVADVFNPIYNFLNEILKVIKPIVYIIFQLIRALASFEPLMLLVSALFNGLTKVISKFVTILTNAINSVIRIINKAISAVNRLPGVSIAKVKYIEEEGEDASSSSSSSSSSASASYTAARDIYMTVNYNNSYVNGDARMIALSIRDEIKRAEALGY